MYKKIIAASITLLFMGCSDSDLTKRMSQNGFEPSGIAIFDGRLVVCSDEGSVGFAKKKDLSKIGFIDYSKNNDFEGVTSSSTNVFLAEEGVDRIIQLSKDFEVKLTFNIDRHYKNKLVLNPKGDGFEAIAFKKETEKSLWFFVSNQSKKLKGTDRSAIMLVKLNKNKETGKIVEYFPMGIKDISGMTYHDGFIYFISDKNNKLYIADEKLSILKSVDLPGDAQEGISIDFDKKIVYIADDEGALLKLTNMDIFI